MTDLDFSVDFRALLGVGQETNRRLAQLSKQIETLRAQEPWDVRIQNSVVIPTPTADTAIGLGGPEVGYIWQVRRIILGGVQWTTTAAGTAEVYVSAEGGGSVASVRGLSEMADQSTTLPSKATYGLHELPLTERQHLHVVIHGGTAGQVYVASAQVTVYRKVTSEQVSAI